MIIDLTVPPWVLFVALGVILLALVLWGIDIWRKERPKKEKEGNG